jgi:hypothetical protein
VQQTAQDDGICGELEMQKTFRSIDQIEKRRGKEKELRKAQHVTSEFITPQGPPRTVAVVAAFLFLATVAATITGTSLLFPAPFWKPLWDLNRPAYLAFEKFGMSAGVFLLLLGIAACATSTGLLRRRRWAWWSAMALFAVNGVGDLAALLVQRDLVKGGSGVAIAACFLISLTRPQVKRFFAPTSI